jgi:fructose-specific phosphotransferase system component IIB
MNGRFGDSIIIMMGCDGLAGTQMAKAFLEKGAKACVGWNGSVSVSHTDGATAQLLQHLVNESQTIRQAVDNTMKEVGPDQEYNNTLEYYPLESGNYAIQR